MWEEKGLWEAATSLEEACARGLMWCHGTSFAETKNGKKKRREMGRAWLLSPFWAALWLGPRRSHQGCVGAPKSWGQHGYPGAGAGGAAWDPLASKTRWGRARAAFAASDAWRAARPGASRPLSPLCTLSSPCSRRESKQMPLQSVGCVEVGASS